MQLNAASQIFLQAPTYFITLLFFLVRNQKLNQENLIFGWISHWNTMKYTMYFEIDTLYRFYLRQTINKTLKNMYTPGGS